jgi:cephalosporin-C deacetylase-like acetyl esterase
MEKIWIQWSPATPQPFGGCVGSRKMWSLTSLSTAVVLIGFAVVVLQPLFTTDSITTSYKLNLHAGHLSSDTVTLDGGIRRQSIFIESPSKKDCEKLHIWVYSAEDSTANNKEPVIVLAHGLGAQKDFGLDAYAVEFSSSGYTCVALDYRTFGGSMNNCNETVVRNHINPWHHVDDILATVRWVKDNKLGWFDSSRFVSHILCVKPFITHLSRIGLWGTSFAGGHMLQVAKALNGDSAIKAVVSQVPHLNGKAASLRAIKNRGSIGSIQIAILSLADMFRSKLGLSPLYIRIASYLDDPFAYMQMTGEQLESYFRKHPATYLGDWKNYAPARTLLYLSQYNPVNAVAEINAPILFIGATQDTLCPIDDVRAAFALVSP